MTYKLTDTLLKLDGISLSFGTKLVLRDINLEVKDIVSESATLGQVTTLLGRSGVGKTQLMKIIAGLQAPTKGNVLIGQDQKAVTPGMVGMVLQDYPLFQHRTLIDNLKLVSDDKDKIEGYMSEFDIIEHKLKYPSQLSGGQRQRAAVVQQLLSSEHFILFDEPFSGLDPVATEKLCKMINKIANLHEKNTVIISSHILEPSIAISDSIWILGNEYYTKAGTAPLPGLEVQQKIDGATILYNENLAAQGLAWNPEIRKDKRFGDMIENVREIFQKI